MKIKYLIVGRTASGKSSIASGVCEKLDLKQVKSYTTRPPRNQMEREGKSDHIFITDEEFDRIPDEQIVAYTKIGNVRYCTTMDILDESDVYVIDPNGIVELLQRAASRTDWKFKIIRVVTHTTETMLSRFIARGGTLELYRQRKQDEDEQFSRFEQHNQYDYVVLNEGPIENAVADVCRYIQHCDAKANSIPVRWIQQYAKDCGWEAGEILEGMVDAWYADFKKR